MSQSSLLIEMSCPAAPPPKVISPVEVLVAMFTSKLEEAFKETAAPVIVSPPRALNQTSARVHSHTGNSPGLRNYEVSGSNQVRAKGAGEVDTVSEVGAGNLQAVRRRDLVASYRVVVLQYQERSYGSIGGKSIILFEGNPSRSLGITRHRGSLCELQVQASNGTGSHRQSALSIGEIQLHRLPSRVRPRVVVGSHIQSLARSQRVSRDGHGRGSRASESLRKYSCAT